MKIVKTIIALLAAAAGLVAAWHWLDASKAIPVPAWTPGDPGGPGDPVKSVDDWIAGMMRATADSAEKNRLAARWTAASVALAGLAAVF